MRLFLLLTCSMLILASCDDRKVLYRENEELSADFEWKKADTRTFVIPVENNASPLELALQFRYATGYMYDVVMMRVTEIAPSGKRVMRDVEFKVRDEKGEFIGEKGYDIIDIEYILDANKSYPEIGNYTYVIEQTMPDIDPLDFAMEVGLTLREKGGDKK